VGHLCGIQGLCVDELLIAKVFRVTIVMNYSIQQRRLCRMGLSYDPRPSEIPLRELPAEVCVKLNVCLLSFLEVVEVFHVPVQAFELLERLLLDSQEAGWVFGRCSITPQMRLLHEGAQLKGLCDGRLTRVHLFTHPWQTHEVLAECSVFARRNCGAHEGRQVFVLAEPPTCRRDQILDCIHLRLVEGYHHLVQDPLGLHCDT
jgi:hypothetical protein